MRSLVLLFPIILGYSPLGIISSVEFLLDFSRFSVTNYSKVDFWPVSGKNSIHTGSNCTANDWRKVARKSSADTVGKLEISISTKVEFPHEYVCYCPLVMWHNLCPSSMIESNWMTFVEMEISNFPTMIFQISVKLSKTSFTNLAKWKKFFTPNLTPSSEINV